MIFIIFIINIPPVLFDTARFTGRVQVVPVAGTVCHGAGTVWENPTRGLPVLNPSQGMVPSATTIYTILSQVSNYDLFNLLLMKVLALPLFRRPKQSHVTCGKWFAVVGGSRWMNMIYTIS